MSAITDTPTPAPHLPLTKRAQFARKRRAEVKRSAVALTALFAQWAKEDDVMTPEEQEQARRESEERQARMNASRTEVGEEPIY